RLLLSRYGRQGVVVNEDFEIKSFRGDTTPFLAHASGSASLDLLKLARPDLVMPLRMALSRATTENQFVSEKHRTRSPAGELEVMIDILPLSAKPASKRLFLILFQEQPVESSSRSKKKDAAPDSKNSRKMKAGETQSVRDELAASKAYLSEIIEQHEASIEELQAAAEEIQSSNEELQSTNEELETTKEEVQSTNEELTTLNDELQQRNREIGEIAGDLANVFASTTIPIAIIGRDLRLRRFTPALSRVMKVIPTDAGRPLSDVKLSFTLPGLDRLISNSIETLAVNRALAKHDDGSMWAVTIRPYQTLEKRVDGAIIVFTDGSEASEERRLALEAAEVARAAAVRSVEELSAAVGRRDRAEGDRTLLLLRLQSAQEEERAHFSRELHDELGQHLTMLGLGLSELSTTAPTGSEIGRRTDELRAIVNTLGRELHGVAQRLRPKGLDDFGLEAALSSYAQDWSKQTGIALDLHISEESERLPLLIETAAYRVAQEAMTNIAKHSGATRAGITIERRDGSLNLIIDDNGKGFESRVVSPSSHAADGMGLIGIRERIALLEGSVQIETGLGDGVTLYIRIPIERSLLGA
ncbi:MAG TPA: PAS domain-containing protein, partial [Gemmatimonadaceae bacterium]|nr:PAS domain-containing protein [Gemmatimonadaceae bacterium]